MGRTVVCNMSLRLCNQSCSAFTAVAIVLFESAAEIAVACSSTNAAESSVEWSTTIWFANAVTPVSEPDTRTTLPASISPMLNQCVTATMFESDLIELTICAAQRNS